MRSSALAMLGPEYGPEVLAQKSRDISAQLGGAAHPFDEAYRYEWDTGLFEWFSSQPAHANWSQVLAANPQALRFQYRSHTAPLTGVMLHDDLMTPGVIYWDDPPPEESGMVRLQLDAQGRLAYFERIPAQHPTPTKETPPADWSALFAAAGLDQSNFQPAEPLWTTLATSDTRMAWTRGSPRQQRVEAAAFRGQPVFFAVIEPWTKPDRTPGASNSTPAYSHSQRAGSSARRNYCLGGVAGGGQFAAGAGRPARGVPAGGVHILRADGAVGGARAYHRFARHFGHVPRGARDLRVLRRGDVDRVYGARTICTAPLASDADLMVGRADRPRPRRGGRARRADRVRGRLGAGGSPRDVRDLAEACGRLAEPGHHPSSRQRSRISGGGVPVHSSRGPGGTVFLSSSSSCCARSCGTSGRRASRSP